MRSRSIIGLFFACGLAVACGDDDSTTEEGEPDAAVADAAVADAHDEDAASHSHGGEDAAAAADASKPADASATFDPSCTVSIRLLDFTLDPATPSVSAGPVVLCARNDGKSTHDLGVRGADMATLGKTEALDPGESGMFTLTMSAGAYAIYCSQGGHESLGMKGTLTVR